MPHWLYRYGDGGIGISVALYKRRSGRIFLVTQGFLPGYLILLSIFLIALAPVSSADIVKPKLPKARGEQCVEPIDIMRRSHFDFMKHSRNKTVYGGIRKSKHSLAGCINCHAGKNAHNQFVSINDPGQFCQSCHTYAAVKIDCFTCHASVPSEQIVQSSGAEND